MSEGAQLVFLLHFAMEGKGFDVSESWLLKEILTLSEPEIKWKNTKGALKFEINDSLSPFAY